MSTQLVKVIREEIARLSRKEIKSHLSTLKSQVAQLRRDNAKLKREVKDLQKEVGVLVGQEKKRLSSERPEAPPEGTRFSPTWVQAHRKKLGLSAADYGRLVGVHQLTIYKWEKGESKPRQSQLAKWAEIRKLGKREALERLKLLGGEEALPKKRGRPRKSKLTKSTPGKRRGRPAKKKATRKKRQKKS